MIYNKITRALYESVEHAAQAQDITKESVVSGMKKGYYLHFKRSNLLRYYKDNKIDITKEELNKYLYT